MVIVAWILLGIFSRIIPHPPNFTVLNALALFGPLFLGSRTLSLLAIFSTLLLTGVFWGPHPTAGFVYLSFGLSVLLGHRFKLKLVRGNSILGVGALSIISSLAFFLITNFGVWMTTSMYPFNLEGLGYCYLAALPFLLNQVAGDLTFGALLYSIQSEVMPESLRVLR